MNFERTLQALLQAIKNRDSNSSFVTIDEQVSLILPNGMFFQGRTAFNNLHAAWFADLDWHWEVKILRTIETAEMAFALMHVDFSDATLGAPSFPEHHYLSLVFTKKDGAWVLVHDQNTVALETGS